MRRATLAAAAQCNFSKLVSVIRKVFVNLILHNYAKNEEEVLVQCLNEEDKNTSKPRIRGLPQDKQLYTADARGIPQRPHLETILESWQLRLLGQIFPSLCSKSCSHCSRSLIVHSQLLAEGVRILEFLL